MTNKVVSITELYDSFNRNDLAGGYAVGVVEKGNVIFQKGYGFANHDYEIPFTDNTVVDFASVAKQFTGYCIAKLIKEGLLTMEDDIRVYLPELPEYDRPIKLHHLLGHTSGLRDWFSMARLAGRNENDTITGDYLMKLITQQRELNFSPGTNFTYSNSGYFLLAQIVERVTKKSLRNYAQEQIFGPLEMKNTFFYDNENEIIKNKAVPYQENDKGIYGQGINRLSSVGSSSLFSTLEDMLKWAVFFDKCIVEGNDVFELMLTPTILEDSTQINYNFGIAKGSWRDYACIGHGGSWNAFACEVVYFPKERISIIFLTNRSPNYVNAQNTIREILLKEPAQESKVVEEFRKKPVNPPEPPVMLSRYFGKYVDRVNDMNQLYHVVNVKQNGNRLLLESTLWPEFVLQQKTPNSFSNIENTRRVVFNVSDQDKCSRVTVEDNGKKYVFQRVEEKIKNFKEAQLFCGEYYSTEIQAGYTISIEEDQLIARQLVNPDISLSRVTDDIYFGNQPWFEDIEFVRDTEDEVEAFLVSAHAGNLTRNLRFEKFE